MAGIILRTTVKALFAVLKWILRAVFAAAGLAFWLAKLFLLLFWLAVSGVSAVAGITSGRR